MDKIISSTFFMTDWRTRVKPKIVDIIFLLISYSESTFEFKMCF